MDTSSSVSELTKQITVLDTVQWINFAWNLVSQDTVRNCFRKAGFNSEACDDKEPCDSNEDETIEQIQSLMRQAGFSDISAVDYIPIDEDVITEDPICDIAEIVRSRNDETCDSLEEKNEDDEEWEQQKEENKIKTLTEACAAVDCLKTFSLKRDTQKLWT